MGTEEAGIIRSILDDDLYKFTMLQAVLREAPDSQAEYRFINRGRQRFNDAFFYELHSQIEAMAALRATKDELDWLRSIPFLHPWFIDYIGAYRYDPREVEIGRTPDNNLSLAARGPRRRTILWEVKLLALISELYYRTVDTNWSNAGQVGRMVAKDARMARAGLHYAEFGTRRRRSFDTQEMYVRYAESSPAFVGTSNMHLARVNGVKAIGTMAHEEIQAWSALMGLRHANRFAMDAWVRTYDGNLGIALTDTFGTKAFFEDFGTKYAKLFDGVRHDSGCPLAFTDKVVAHYRKLGIDPSSKTIVFSDGLDVDKAISVAAYCKTAGIRSSFGIGTHLTNDYEGSPALNIVIKLWSLNGIPVVKLSDVSGKETGDQDAIRVAKWTFEGTPL